MERVSDSVMYVFKIVLVHERVSPLARYVYVSWMCIYVYVYV